MRNLCNLPACQFLYPTEKDTSKGSYDEDIFRIFLTPQIQSLELANLMNYSHIFICPLLNANADGKRCSSKLKRTAS